jgi:hypothetical protein
LPIAPKLCMCSFNWWSDLHVPDQMTWFQS